MSLICGMKSGENLSAKSQKGFCSSNMVLLKALGTSTKRISPVETLLDVSASSKVDKDTKATTLEGKNKNTWRIEILFLQIWLVN